MTNFYLPTNVQMAINPHYYGYRMAKFGSQNIKFDRQIFFICFLLFTQDNLGFQVFTQELVCTSNFY